MPSFLDDNGLNKFFQAIKAKFDTRYLNGPANALIEQNKKSFLKVWRGTVDEFKQVEAKESDTAYLVEGESADTEYAPITHAARHSKDGVDPILPTTIGAIDYNAAQSLTDGQKTQARNNIGAAPSGFGLGEDYAHEVISDCNDARLSGLYIMSTNTINYPPLIDNGKYGLLRVSARIPNEILQEVFCIGISGQSDFSAVRSSNSTDGWLPWECINPPHADWYRVPHHGALSGQACVC